MSDIFISYVAENGNTALLLAEQLDTVGYSSWLYERDILPGASYLMQTGRAIEACKAFLLLISPESVASNQVSAEVVRAFEERKPIVPLRLGITHADLQRRQPDWRQALGPAASIAINPQDLGPTFNRVVGGLKLLNVEPTGSHKPALDLSDLGRSPQRRWKVFISARSAHKQVVGSLCAYLEERGVTVFSPGGVVDSSTNLGRLIDLAIDTVSYMIVLGGCPSDFTVGWVEYEWRSFLNEVQSGRKEHAVIIPVLLAGTAADLPWELRMSQFIKFDPSGPERAFGKVLYVIAAQE